MVPQWSRRGRARWVGAGRELWVLLPLETTVVLVTVPQYALLC